MNNVWYSKKYIDEKVIELIKEVEKLKSSKFPPHLKVILVGDNKASLSYIKNKKRMCEKIGARFSLIKLDKDISKQNFLSHINQMNEDPKVTGCFVQLPVPNHLKEIDITEIINPKKDVDGFHSQSILGLYKNRPNYVSCTPKGIVALLKYHKIKIEGANVCIIGRGPIVGKPLSLILQNLNATVTLCHSKTKNIKTYTQKADIIICAIGKMRFLDEQYLNKEQNQIVIDVGINIDEKSKLCGDSDFENIKDKVRGITPVPGGVGPMTVLSLMENLIYSSKIANNLKEYK